MINESVASQTAGNSANVAWGRVTYEADSHAAEALATAPRSGSPVAHDDTPGLIRSVADAVLNLKYKEWDFGDSVAFEALIAASDNLADESWARFAHGFGRAWAVRAKPFARLDCTVPGRALVTLAMRYRDRQLLERLVELADYLMARPLIEGVYETWHRSPLIAPYGGAPLGEQGTHLLSDPPPGVFVDCLHFDPPFLTSLGIATGDKKYVDAGVSQALGYIRNLQRPDGLFDHFLLAGESGTFGSGWGRGQGWAILGLLEVGESIAVVPGDEYKNQALAIDRSARTLLGAMVNLQRPDGHWYAVVDDVTSGDEHSTAGFMAHALGLALERGLVSGPEYVSSLNLARNAILGALDSGFQLTQVSAAVYASTESSHYKHVPRGFVVPWGQGPALLALIANRSEVS